MRASLTAVSVCALISGVCLGEGVAPAFTKKPTAVREGGAVRIEFAVGRPTDVAVFIEEAGEKGPPEENVPGGKGTRYPDVKVPGTCSAPRVVRHLAAGVLGKNAPAPLKADSLEQSLTWDGKADYGKDAGPGPFKVRVALGLGARFDKVVLADPLSLGNVQALAAGPDGTLYVVIGCGGTGPVWGGQQMVALNRDGTYARMVQPFPATLAAERVKGFDVVDLSGRPAPIVHDIAKRNFYAALSPRKSGMAVTAEGTILRLIGEHREPVPFSIGALDGQGGAPWGRYAGPPLLKLTRGIYTGRPFVAAGSTGRCAYVSGLGQVRPDEKDKNKQQVTFAAVYRVPLPERGPAEVFFGVPEERGNDQTHLAGPPHGLAADGKGHLLIADHANNRVLVVTEADGKFVGSFEVERPDGLAVDPTTGAVYVTRLTGKGAIELVKLSGITDPKPLARLSLPNSGNPDCPWLMALDAGAKPSVVWLGSDGGSLLRVEDLGDAFGKPKNVNTGTLGNASFVDLSVDRVRKEVYARISLGPYIWVRFNEETGEVARVRPEPYPSAAGSQLVAGPDGFLYSPAYNQNILRFDRAGKPAPWESIGKPSLTVPVSMTFLTHTIGVRHDGHIFIFAPGHTGGRPPKMLHEYLPTGERVTQDPIIWKVTDTAVGPKFDAAGNIYVAEQVKPLGEPYPSEFAGLVGPVEVSKTYLEGVKATVVGMYGSVVKFTPKGGMVHVGEENPFKGEAKLDGALKTLDAASFRGGRLYPVKVTGAEWIRTGISHVDLAPCNCENTRFDVDEFGRVFYPDLGRFRVGVLDTNGNAITHFGRYGNADTTDDIAFSWLIGVGVTDRYAYMGDSLNRRLLRARLTYAAEETCPVP